MFENLKVWMNGKLVPWNNANVHLLSHGFSRASAIFDVFGIHPSPDGPVAFRMDKHLERFFRSAELLGMEIMYDKNQITEAVAECVKANNIKRGLIKILGYYSEEAIISLVLDSKLDVAIFAIPESDEIGLDSAEPISICFSDWRKIHPATVPVEAKACSNYLNGMLARKSAKQRGYDVGIFLTTDGYVAEGSIESLFMVKDGILKTSKLGNILRSITRMTILELAPKIGIETKETDIMPQELLAADEIFLSHTGIKVGPVNRIEDRTLSPVPGEITKKLQQALNDIITFKDERFKDWLQPIDI